jgi:ketosteroid isomerase-like protein
MTGIDRTLTELHALNARFIHNFVTNDVASHDALLHPRFLCISSNGARVDRVTYLRHWAQGFDPLVMTYWDLRDESIDVFGDMALVRAVNKYTMTSAAGPLTRMSAYTDTYVHENGKWLCVQAQITPVALAHYPDDRTVLRRYINGKLV